MPLVINHIEQEPEWLDEWPVPLLPHFMSSQAFAILKRELGRYIRQEVNGRSFLIAGHRGAGKTALVRRAVEETGREVISEAMRPGAPPVQPGLQRPLIVKIHGPSLFSQRLPGLKEEEAAGDPAERSQPAMTALGHGALVQITIALYRALATEIARSFRIHAREAERVAGGDYLELAGGLALELDRAPSPAVLRAFWHRLNRLKLGVLWPNAIGEQLSRRGEGDQGIREILALVTAGQAFQVCSGVVSSVLSEKRASSAEAASEGRIGIELKDGVNRVTGLLLGGLAGGGAALAGGAGTGGAAMIAAGTALVGAMGASRSTKRVRNQQQDLDYKFILDRSVETLDRDLPLVIDRVREAGLAPVFVVDELDKVERLDLGIAGLFSRLKHLTTDIGFFCFLTDRGFYNHIRTVLETSAYPTEHTFFSHWLFALSRPDEFVQYVERLIRIDGDPPDDPGSRLAKVILARTILHRGKFNMIDVTREIAGLCDQAGQLRPTSTELRSKPQFRLTAILQIAIEHVLSDEDVRSRMDGDPRHSQAVIDGMYLISRAWERGEDSVVLDETVLADHLLGRLQDKAGKTAGNPGGGDGDGDGAEPGAGLAMKRQAVREKLGVELDHLLVLVHRLADLLCDFAALREQVRAGGGPALPDGLFPTDLGDGLLRRKADCPSPTYDFRFDSHGRSRAAMAAARADRLQSLAPAIRRNLDFLARFRELLAMLDLELGDLTRFQVLPSSLSMATLEGVEARLQQVLAGQAYPEASSDLPVLASLPSVVRELGRGLSQLLYLSAYVRQVNSDLPPDRVRGDRTLQGMARYMDLEDAVRHGVPEFLVPEGAGIPILTDDAESISSWMEAVGQQLDHVPVPAEPGFRDVIHAWSEWAPLIIDFLKGVRGVGRQTRKDIVFAAAGVGPGCLMRRYLSDLTVADWSEVCLAGIDASYEAGWMPAWVPVAALRALGFGRPALEVVVDVRRSDIAPSWDLLERESAEHDLDILHQILDDAGPAPAGMVVLVEDGELPQAVGKGRAGIPVFVVRSERIQRYNGFLNRLRDVGAIKGIADGRRGRQE